MCAHVAATGCTHTVYHKTLQLAISIQAVSKPIFFHTIESMYPMVKGMLDKVCEIANNGMKDMNQGELDS